MMGLGCVQTFWKRDQNKDGIWMKIRKETRTTMGFWTRYRVIHEKVSHKTKKNMQKKKRKRNEDDLAET